MYVFYVVFVIPDFMPVMFLCTIISTKHAYLLCSLSDKLVLHLSQELKRLQRRKAMVSGEESSSHSTSGNASGPGSPGCSKEQPLFTLKQVSGTVRLHLVLKRFISFSF